MKNKNKLDIKELGIPNVCFSMCDEPWAKKQRIKNGFDASELWNFDSTISAFILPRLKMFKKIHHGYPGELTPKQWVKTIDKMIVAFEMVADDDLKYNNTKADYKRNMKKIDEGLQLFAKWFLSLWD